MSYLSTDWTRMQGHVIYAHCMCKNGNWSNEAFLIYPHLPSPPPPPVLVDAAFFLAILLYSLVRPIHLAAWWYPILFYIQVKMHLHLQAM